MRLISRNHIAYRLDPELLDRFIEDGQDWRRTTHAYLSREGDVLYTVPTTPDIIIPDSVLADAPTLATATLRTVLGGANAAPPEAREGLPALHLSGWTSHRGHELALASPEPARETGYHVASSDRLDAAALDGYASLHGPLELLSVRSSDLGGAITDLQALAGRSGAHYVILTSYPDAWGPVRPSDGYYLPNCSMDEALHHLRSMAGGFIEGVWDLNTTERLPLLGARYEHVTILFGGGLSRRLAVALAHAEGNGPDEERLGAWRREREVARVQRVVREAREHRILTAQHDATQYEHRARDLLRQYLEAVQEAQDRRRMPAMLPELEAADERNIDTLRRMLQVGSIHNVDMNGTNLAFDTKRIYVQDDRSGAWHDLGAFRVSLDIRHGAFNFQNTLARLGTHHGTDHPHVQNGRPCLGSLAEAVPQALADNNWGLLAEMAFAYLESANTNDIAGKWVHEWPIVVDPEAVGLPPHEGERTHAGMVIPDVPEDGSDYGEFGRDAAVRRGGVTLRWSARGYVDDDLRVRRHIRESGEFDPGDVDPGNFDPSDIVMVAGVPYTYDEERRRFVNGNGRPLGPDPLRRFHQRVHEHLDGDYPQHVDAWEQLTPEELQERYDRARGRTADGVRHFIRDREEAAA